MKLSILIPVYNAGIGVETCIRSALKVQGNTEVLVIDDCSEEKTKSILKKIYDEASKENPKFRVEFNQVRLGMRGNYVNLINKASGDWICIIGQDDYIRADAVRVIEEMTILYPTNEILQFKRSYFYWNNNIDGRKSLTIKIRYGNSKKIIRSTEKDYLDIKKGAKNYLDIPKIYTGTIIKNKLIQRHGIDKIMTDYPIPDVGSSVGLNNLIQKYVYVDTPLMITGTSPASTGLIINNMSKSNSRNFNSKIENYESEYIRKAFDASRDSLPGMKALIATFSWYWFEAKSIHGNTKNVDKNLFLALSLVEEIKLENFIFVLHKYTKIIVEDRYEIIRFILYVIFFANIRTFRGIIRLVKILMESMMGRTFYRKIYFSDEKQIEGRIDRVV
jgi:glycosyltransferase involved in cell wall biosynthesis